jgi:glutamyl-tRNA reductase
MDYRNEALKIQKEIIILIEREDFDGIENLLNRRKEFYLEYSNYNSEELKNFLNSQEYKDLEIKISTAFNIAKDKVKQEIDKIKSSKNASKQYQSNMGHLSGFFNKKI